MAQAITVKHGDTITKILKDKKGLQAHTMRTWLSKIGPINPHISDLNHIYPGENILIPETLNENIDRTQVWRNAFSKIPRALANPYHGPTIIYFIQPGDTIEKVGQYMFSSSPYRTMAASNKRALLIHNNPYLENYLTTNPLPINMLLNITPAILSEMEKNHWQIQQTPLKMSLDQMEQQLRDMLEQAGPESTYSIAQMVEQLKAYGASMGTKEAVTAAGYGIAGVSSHAAAGSMAVNNVNGLMRELYNEAIEKFGKKTVHTAKANNLKQMQNFLKGHPKYRQLIKHLKELPNHLLPRGNFMTVNPGQTNCAIARAFRKQVSLPLKKWHNPSLYVGRMAKQLNGRLSRFKNVGRCATWYVPALLGVASVAVAPAEQRMRTLFEEGFGVLGGAMGTKLGIGVGLGIVFVFGLGPVGMFVAVFICASAGGIAGMEFFKNFGSGLYEYGNGQIYHSPEQLITGNLK